MQPTAQTVGGKTGNRASPVGAAESLPLGLRTFSRMPDFHGRQLRCCDEKTFLQDPGRPTAAQYPLGRWTDECVPPYMIRGGYLACATNFTTSRSAQRPSYPSPSGSPMNAQCPPSAVSMYVICGLRKIRSRVSGRMRMNGSFVA